MYKQYGDMEQEIIIIVIGDVILIINMMVIHNY